MKIGFAISICLLWSSCGPAVDSSFGPSSEKPVLAETPDSISGATSNWARGVAYASAGDSQWTDKMPSQCEGPMQTMLGADEEISKEPIPFSHCEHQSAGIRCSTCHHDGSEGKACGGGDGCHERTARTAPNLETAFHRACRPCHLKQGLAEDCSFCHKSESGRQGD